jgi:hypothetical protein
MPVTITLPENLAQELRARAESQQLLLDELVADILTSVFAQSESSYHNVLAPSEDIPEFWKMAFSERIPEPPPPTPEGDRIALAAVEWISGRFPITDPKEARWHAENEEAALYNVDLYDEDEDDVT